jgi:hypothetical protein
MLGYRTYFNGSEFIADDVKTEDCSSSLPCDTTTSWFAEKKFADLAVEKYNTELQDVKICKQCGEYFWQSEDERQWFADRNMKAPCRCFSCRKKIAKNK